LRKVKHEGEGITKISTQGSSQGLPEFGNALTVCFTNCKEQPCIAFFHDDQKKLTTGFRKMECPQEPNFRFLKSPAGF
jgi:hypothetical protein